MSDAAYEGWKQGQSESIWTDEEIERALSVRVDGLCWTMRAALDAVPAVPLREFEALRDAAQAVVAVDFGTAYSRDQRADALVRLRDVLGSSRAGGTEG